MATDNAISIVGVSGPFREPMEPVLSYDYTVQRVSWPMPHAVRVKVSIAEELDVLKGNLIGVISGTPGQQLLVNQVLSRRIADAKLHIAEDEGLLSERRDVIVAPFTGPLAHLFGRLDSWMGREQDSLRAEVKKRVGV